jgi:hypothetical protein
LTKPGLFKEKSARVKPERTPGWGNIQEHENMTRFSLVRNTSVILMIPFLLGFLVAMYLMMPEPPKLRNYFSLIDAAKKHEKLPQIQHLISKDRSNPYRYAIISALIRERKFQYTDDFLDLFSKLLSELEPYVKTVTVMRSWKDLNRVITDEERSALNELKEQKPKQYRKLIRSLSVKETYLDLTDRPDLRQEILACMLYFSEIPSDNPNVKENLNDFFSKYIFVPQIQGGERDFLVDRAFISTYIKYHSIKDIIRDNLQQLTQSKISANAWPLEPVKKVIYYFQSIGEGISQHFYAFLNIAEINKDPIRIYLGVKVLQSIGFDDGALRKLLGQSFPEDVMKWEITANKKVIEKINMEEEIKKAIENIKGKADVDMHDFLLKKISENAGDDARNALESYEHKKKYLFVAAVFFLVFLMISTYLPKYEGYSGLSLIFAALLLVVLRLGYLSDIDTKLYYAPLTIWPLLLSAVVAWSADFWENIRFVHFVNRLTSYLPLHVLAGLLRHAKLYYAAGYTYAEIDDSSLALTNLLYSRGPKAEKIILSLPEISMDPHQINLLCDQGPLDLILGVAQKCRQYQAISESLLQKNQESYALQVIQSIENAQTRINLAKRLNLTTYIATQRPAVNNLIAEINTQLKAKEIDKNVLTQMDVVVESLDVFDQTDKKNRLNSCRLLSNYAGYALAAKDEYRAEKYVRKMCEFTDVELDLIWALVAMRIQDKIIQPQVEKIIKASFARALKSMNTANGSQIVCGQILGTIQEFYIMIPEAYLVDTLKIAQVALAKAKDLRIPLTLLQILKRRIEDSTDAEVVNAYNQLIKKHKKKIDSEIKKNHRSGQS